jgi:hypothetical protein
MFDFVGINDRKHTVLNKLSTVSACTLTTVATILPIDRGSLCYLIDVSCPVLNHSAIVVHIVSPSANCVPKVSVSITECSNEIALIYDGVVVHRSRCVAVSFLVA